MLKYNYFRYVLCFWSLNCDCLSLSLLQAFAFVLWVVCWSNLFYAFHEITQNRTPSPVYFVTPLIAGITMVGVPFSFYCYYLHGEKKYDDGKYFA